MRALKFEFSAFTGQYGCVRTYWYSVQASFHDETTKVKSVQTRSKTSRRSFCQVEFYKRRRRRNILHVSAIFGKWIAGESEHKRTTWNDYVVAALQRCLLQNTGAGTNGLMLRICSSATCFVPATGSETCRSRISIKLSCHLYPSSRVITKWQRQSPHVALSPSMWQSPTAAHAKPLGRRSRRVNIAWAWRHIQADILAWHGRYAVASVAVWPGLNFQLYGHFSYSKHIPIC